MATQGIDSGEELYKLRKVNFDLSAVRRPKTLLAVILSPVVVAVLGAASRGDVFLYAVLAWMNWDKLTGQKNVRNDTNALDDVSMNGRRNEQESDVVRSDLNAFLHRNCLDGVFPNTLAAIALSFVIFFGLGGFLQWHYYIKRRGEPEKWKCQPNKFLSKENERHEIFLGSTNLALGATISGIIATLVMNGAPISTLYFNVSDYGWIYFVISTVLNFLYQDASAYYIHRMLHWPYFYKKFHKLHHRYHSPTAFSAVAMHPVEFLTLQGALMVPMFVVPVHFAGFLCCIFYVYYYGMIDHSGIDLQAFWPWQPPVRFHDDHHKLFHVNFGFNTLLFDGFHDTLRKKTRIYSEDIYGGKGAERKEKLAEKDN